MMGPSVRRVGRPDMRQSPGARAGTCSDLSGSASFSLSFLGFYYAQVFEFEDREGKERTRDYAAGTSTTKLSLAIPSSPSDRARLRPIRHSFKPSLQLKT